MISFSFGNQAFNREYAESSIGMVIDSKCRYAGVDMFLKKAISYLDEVVYNGGDFAAGYDGTYLRKGEYKTIVQNWLSALNKTTEIHIDEINNIYRVVRSVPDPCCDEFVIETGDEFVFLSWSATA